jgi:nitrous oxidase accessory protein NosD
MLEGVLGRLARLAAAALMVMGVVAVTAATASAAVSYVSKSAPPVAHGKSCVEPNYASVQEAITAGAATIDVCPGTYTERLVIEKAVKLAAADGPGTATVALPAGEENSTTACDVKEGLEQIDEVSICKAGTVSITGLNVEALIPLETCAKGLNGIFVGEGSTLKASNLTVDGASTTLDEYKGCQHGIAISVGSISPLEAGTATLTKVTSIGYEKNGPTVSGEGSSLTMKSSTVTGEGPTPWIAQNGVQVAYGAKGVIRSSEITGNECDYPSVCGPTTEQASGVLFYEAAAGSSIIASHVDENDLGIYYSEGATTDAVALSKDRLTANRYEGIYLEEGDAALNTVTIEGSGRVGIELNQDQKQTAAIEDTAAHTHISGQSEASIKVTSDKKSGDIEGKFTLTDSTAAAPVLIDESNNLEVVI